MPKGCGGVVPGTNLRDLLVREVLVLVVLVVVLRHPEPKLNTPPSLFCMSWCNLTLSSGGHTALALPVAAPPSPSDPLEEEEPDDGGRAHERSVPAPHCRT